MLDLQVGGMKVVKRWQVKAGADFNISRYHGEYYDGDKNNDWNINLTGLQFQDTWRNTF